MIPRGKKLLNLCVRSGENKENAVSPPPEDGRSQPTIDQASTIHYNVTPLASFQLPNNSHGKSDYEEAGVFAARRELFSTSNPASNFEFESRAAENPLAVTATTGNSFWFEDGNDVSELGLNDENIVILDMTSGQFCPLESLASDKTSTIDHHTLVAENSGDALNAETISSDSDTTPSNTKLNTNKRILEKTVTGPVNEENKAKFGGKIFCKEGWVCANVSKKMFDHLQS
ncbi:hypothetical protein GE061_001613 [Apolygus lucorum]|uniref:Uncharacterized protein n=1 Tax=Apolygus lucorum TaxID=248454 RepID=A0A8S9Y9V0_APOLU|nr:hypothetical protein GE061_001613 [Apolygus lucorum]